MRRRRKLRRWRPRRLRRSRELRRLRRRTRWRLRLLRLLLRLRLLLLLLLLLLLRRRRRLRLLLLLLLLRLWRRVSGGGREVRLRRACEHISCLVLVLRPRRQAIVVPVWRQAIDVEIPPLRSSVGPVPPLHRRPTDETDEALDAVALGAAQEAAAQPSLPPLGVG